MTLDFTRRTLAVADLIANSIVIVRSPVGSQTYPFHLLLIAALLPIGAILFTALENKPARAAASIELVEVDAKVVAKGYPASKLIGTKIYNAKGEKIGTLDELVIEGDNVNFAVLQVGGFLGIGGKLVVVPYKDLSIDAEGDKIVLGGGSKEQLMKLAGYEYKALGAAPTGLLSRVVPTMSSPSGSQASGPTGAIDKAVPPMKP
ncbi:PRC-barrel domain-containing protein [Hyphomicrobium sp. ghe19]|uniref:PRC-barrel domain-containing protein n=1 Tax=Hyphomicrobium sp. ghe19 TaxID=2682968 RepID=UPI00136751E9|nr:hypothetical protein HYPP_02677 [Hyphomicrobium sp. ghe19]